MATNLPCIPLNPIIETIALQTWTNLFCELIVSQGSCAWYMPYIDFGFLMQSIQVLLSSLHLSGIKHSLI